MTAAAPIKIPIAAIMISTGKFWWSVAADEGARRVVAAPTGRTSADFRLSADSSHGSPIIGEGASDNMCPSMLYIPRQPASLRFISASRLDLGDFSLESLIYNLSGCTRLDQRLITNCPLAILLRTRG